MPIKSVKIKLSKNKKNAFLSHVPRIIIPKNQAHNPKGMSCSPFMDGHTYTKTDRVTTADTLSGFQDFYYRVLSIIINSFQSPTLCQKRCLNETEIGHYSKTPIWRRWFPLQFGVVLVLSFEYHIQSIKVHHWSNKHWKCPIWIIGDVF